MRKPGKSDPTGARKWTGVHGLQRDISLEGCGMAILQISLENGGGRSWREVERTVGSWRQREAKR